MNRFILSFCSLIISIPIFAYIGPGMSGGLLVAIISFFAAVFLALWGILYYPIKRAIKRRKDKKWYVFKL